MWGFDATRDIVIARLSKATDPITKILMYDDAKYALDPYSWFLPAVKVFVSRKEKLALDEGLKLGMSHTLRICAAREDCARIRFGDVNEIIAQVYDLPRGKRRRTVVKPSSQSSAIVRYTESVVNLFFYIRNVLCTCYISS